MRSKGFNRCGSRTMDDVHLWIRLVVVVLTGLLAIVLIVVAGTGNSADSGFAYNLKVRRPGPVLRIPQLTVPLPKKYFAKTDCRD